MRGSIELIGPTEGIRMSVVRIVAVLTTGFVMAAGGFVAVIASSAPAHATATTYLELATAADATGDIPLDSHSYQYENIGGGPQTGTFGASAENLWIIQNSHTGAAFVQSATANTYGKAEFGRLHAAVGASGFEEAGAFEYNPCIPDIPCYSTNPYGAASFAGASLYWQDTITITSGTLPVGAAVQILYGVDLHASWGALGNGSPAPCVGQGINPSATAQVQALGSGAAAIGLQTGACARYIVTGSSVSSGDQITDVFTAAIGDTFNFLGTLDAFASASVGVGSDPYTDKMGVGIDASNTSNFILRILTPGVTYVSDSGTIYPTDFPAESVPEPTSLAVLTTGILGLLRLRRAW
jgi:hypothetical protein